MHVSYLPRAVAAGARIRAGVEVEPGPGRGRPRGRSRAAGAEAGDGRGRAFTVRARRAVIVAGGALGTPELLLRSGLGGAQVGRNLHIHPACWVGARYEEEVRGWDGVMQSYYVDEWEPRAGPARGDLHAARLRRRLAARRRAEHQEAMLDFGHVGSIGVHLSDESVGPGRARRATARCGPPTG